MANVDRPNGFRPYGELLRVRPYYANGTIYPGDLVKQEGGDNSSTQKGIAVVVASAGTDAVIGAAMSYAVEGGEVLIADHPDQLFKVQADDNSIADGRDLGLNAELEPTAGDSTYKQSRMEVDASTKATTAALPIKILGLARGVVGQEGEYGSFARLVVAINNHQLKGGTGTDGV